MGPVEESTGRGKGGTAVVVRKAVDIIIQERTSLGRPAATKAENGARVETPAMSLEVPATAAKQPDGGALMTTWIVTAAFWWVQAGVVEAIPPDTRPWMLPFRSLP